MLHQATSFVASAQLSAASRSVRDASRDFSATEAPDTATMSMPSTPSLSGTWLKTSQPSRLAQISCVYWVGASADAGVWRCAAVNRKCPTPPNNPVQQNSARCVAGGRSEEHTSELQSLMRTSYAVFCLQKKNKR